MDIIKNILKEKLSRGQDYPTLKNVRGYLRNWPRVKYDVINAFIVGSEAKGLATPNSDLDIAVVIKPIRGKSSLEVTERYHDRFNHDLQKPKWKGRMIDIQFFYADDEELQTYSKISLAPDQIKESEERE